MKSLFFSIFLILPNFVNAKIELINNTDNKDIQGFLSLAENLLPPAFHELEKKVEVRFEKLDDFTELKSPCDGREEKEKEQIFGNLNKGVITLNRNFIPHLNNTGSTDFSCGHKSFHKLLIATLIHEVAHIYDIDKKISSQTEYMALVNVGQNFRMRPKIKNQNTSRSPDPYEFYNLEEHFAVNAEFFLLDKEYRCRRPNLASYFIKTFKTNDEQCSNFPSIRVKIKDQFNEIDLSPENVETISFVLAGNGDKAMSKFGHALFKLKLKDSQNEIMAGFLGIINDMTINNLKGLTGAYASRIVIGDYDETVTKYNKEEFRDLSEYPLKLNSEEKRIFLQQLVTLYFEYSGRYYFITNNCATEALSLIKTAKSGKNLFKENPVSPKGVLKTLVKYDIVNQTPEKIHPSYMKTLKKIHANALPALNGTPLKTYLKSNADKRQGSINLNLDMKASYRSLFVLERVKLKMNLKKVEEEIAKEINKLDESHEMKELSQKAIILSNVLIAPDINDDSYGIPLNSYPQEDLTSIQEEIKKILNDISLWARDNYDSKVTEETKKTEANLSLIKEKLKSLTEESVF